jgi:hypothetical protein
MERDALFDLQCPQQPTTEQQPEPHASSLQSQIRIVNAYANIIFYLRLGLSSDNLLSGFPTKILSTVVKAPPHFTTQIKHLALIAVIIYGEELKVSRLAGVGSTTKARSRGES